MATGIIKFFDPAKGAGIIQPDFPGDNLYLEVSQVMMDIPENLPPGQRVSYIKAISVNGLQARCIRLLVPLNNTQD
ncbi:cold-shock protein [Chromobacterium sp. ATCC 53434]|uniref:cold-shock protein n=1 Tax=Chromobacterium TaxID=535 RepID=UPI000C793CE0|nr:cold shock domain-containing protein [Chromobacterium sp. ATCC 53434]AUH53460.1 cold-shock protein [Chromobacterium sp. ATCC 53434]